MWRPVVFGLAVLIPMSVLTAGAALSQGPKSKDLDRQHDEIIKDFLNRTHKLALQYQQAGQYGKARDTLDLILKVAPNDEQAKLLLDKMQKQEMSDNKKTLKIMANQTWQRTGVHVLEGKPFQIEAKGDWVFIMRRTVGAEGLEMPDDMKKFPLGSLIGLIDVDESAPRRDGRADRDAGRPFLIGAQKVFDRAPVSGMLFLKIHDTEESDNQGLLTVSISGQVR